MTEPSRYDAVIFDLGGVILESPKYAFQRREEELSLPPYSIARVLKYGGEQGVWARLERGEIGLEDFYEPFDAELSRGGVAASARALMQYIAEVCKVRPLMLDTVRRLREAGLRVGALTNNWISNDAQYQRMDELRGEFHVFVESCRVGMRKPETGIYELACNQLEVSPERAIFLDDLGHNLKAAKALGLTTVKVDDPVKALNELQAHLGLQLLPAESHP